MTIKTKNIIVATSLFVMTLGFVSVLAPSVNAVVCPDGFDAGTISENQASMSGDPCANHQTGTSQLDDVEASNSNPTQGVNLQANCKPPNGEELDSENCGIVGYIVVITRVMSAAVGVVVVIMIAVGGLQYSAARDDPQAVSAAKTRIRNAIVALVFYVFTFAFLQWLVPGGVF